MRVLITGSAGFIGFHLARRLLEAGVQVVGIDNHNAYYDPALKAAREAMLTAHPGYLGLRGAIETPGLLTDLMARHQPRIVVHLAAQAGVRHSIEAPASYVATNLEGSFQLLEAARAHPPAHLIMASSSSVYGGSDRMPYRETDRTDLPMSFYAATKKSTEAMGHSYAALYGLPITMLRFFTVYGPWGRPDMATFLFTRALLQGRPIPLFNHGRMRRDFTYIDDLIGAIRDLMELAPPPPRSKSAPQFAVQSAPQSGPQSHPASRIEGDSLSPVAPFRVVNIGNGAPVEMMRFVQALEAATGRRARLEMLPMQPGDVEATWADTTLLQNLTGARPHTPIEQGLAQYVDWFRSYYRTEGLQNPSAIPA